MRFYNDIQNKLDLGLGACASMEGINWNEVWRSWMTLPLTWHAWLWACVVRQLRQCAKLLPCYHHEKAEGSFTAKKWFGHRAGRSPCVHSIGKFFLCYIVPFLRKLPPPGLPGSSCNTCRCMLYFSVSLSSIFIAVSRYSCSIHTYHNYIFTLY